RFQHGTLELEHTDQPPALVKCHADFLCAAPNIAVKTFGWAKKFTRGGSYIEARTWLDSCWISMSWDASLSRNRKALSAIPRTHPAPLLRRIRRCRKTLRRFQEGAGVGICGICAFGSRCLPANP